MYFRNGARTGWWPKFPAQSTPKYCWTISQGTYCKDNVDTRAPRILKFSVTPQQVSGGTQVKIEWKVVDGWEINVKAWCDWCIGHDNEDSPYLDQQVGLSPDAYFYTTIPGDWKESPKYTVRLYAYNAVGMARTGPGQSIPDIVLQPSNNILNQTGAALKSLWDGVSSAVIAFAKKLSECASTIGGEIGNKFKDVWGFLAQVGGYILQAGTNLATGGTGGGAVQAACMTGMVSLGTALGTPAAGIGAIAGAAIGYTIGGIGCPLAENAGWTIVDTILCLTGARTNIVNSDNIRLVVGITEAISKIPWDKVGQWFSGIIDGGVAKFFNTIPATGTGAGGAAAATAATGNAIASNSVAIVGTGSAPNTALGQAANSLQSNSNTASALFNPTPVNPNSLDSVQKIALDQAGKSGSPLIQGTNILVSGDAQNAVNLFVTNNGGTAEQAASAMNSWLNSLDGLSQAIYHSADHFHKVCMLVNRSVTACPLNP
ncbi:hypothetical protein HY621_04175 [Candidatus Uhrbacteria bacterium]|nr:hypothetical protein [Candidatus Uhrbacteria bacterium]